MAGGQAKSNLNRTKRQGQGPIRKSARLEEKRRQQESTSINQVTNPKPALSSARKSARLGQPRQQESTSINQVTNPKPALSSIRKSARLEKRRQLQSTSINQVTNPKPVLSSSSTSHASSQKTSQKSPFSQEAVNPSKSFEAVNPSNSPKVVNPPNPPEAVNPSNSPKVVNPPNSPEAVNPSNSPKVVNPPNSPEAVNPSNSLKIVSPPNSLEVINPSNSFEAVNPPNNLEPVNPSSSSHTKKKLYDNPIEHWRNTGTWPKKYFQPDPNMSQQRLIRKRPASTMRYAEGVRKRKNPAAHTPQFEQEILNPAGIFMAQELGEAAICDDGRQLCSFLLDAKYEPPEKSLFEGDLFIKVLNASRSRNEARVVRDVLPCLVPSAELLFINGLLKNEGLIEEIQGNWKKCIPLADPTPRPEFMVGFQSSAFTNIENTKLKKYAGPVNPTLFTKYLYFPFLICEVKSGEIGLNIADRQNARSASAATNAILQLYQAVSRAEQIHRKILVFSISLDLSAVRIYGHYVLIKDKITFHQHLIASFVIFSTNDQNKWTSYNFVRKLYDHFASVHLKRIRDALSLLEYSTESIANVDDDSNLIESDKSDSQEPITIASSVGAVFTALQKDLKQQRDEFTKWEDRVREESKQRHEELMELLKTR